MLYFDFLVLKTINNLQQAEIREMILSEFIKNVNIDQNIA